MKSKFVEKITASAATKTDPNPSIFISSCAGSGKTFTLVEGVRAMLAGQSSHVPSPEQKAIWDSLALSKPFARTICFVSLGTEITATLKRRCPLVCDVMTVHSMGYRALRKMYPNATFDARKTENLIADALGYRPDRLRLEKPELLGAISKLVDLARMTLMGWNAQEKRIEGFDSHDLEQLVDHYDLDIPDEGLAFSAATQVLTRCFHFVDGDLVDHIDQIWLPVVKRLHFFKYDMLLVDEAQDLNRCQHEIVWAASRRLVVCGDGNQAIYGFAGSDVNSLERIKHPTGNAGDLRRWVNFELTVTRRCHRSIVTEAKQWTDKIEAMDDAPDGMTVTYVKHGMHANLIKDGDMILSRYNAPLVGEAIKLVMMGKKVRILGQDITKPILKLIQRLKPTSVADLVVRCVPDWFSKECGKLSAVTAVNNKTLNVRRRKLRQLEDKRNCILYFAGAAKTLVELYALIESLSSTKLTPDGKYDGITCTTIHKAKGLEADRVWLLMMPGCECPSPNAATLWQKKQERNLRYIAITRAIDALYYVV